jgi:hypothetical protein
MPTSQSARLHLEALAQLAEALADGVGRERGDPQALERLAAAGRLVDVAEDQLALAPGVRGADDLFHLGVVEHAADRLELILGLLGDHQRPFPGEDRQVIAPPAPPFGVDLVRLRQGDQMADGPGHHIAVPLETAVSFLAGAQNAREIPGDGRLFGDDGGFDGRHIREVAASRGDFTSDHDGWGGVKNPAAGLGPAAGVQLSAFENSQDFKRNCKAVSRVRAPLRTGTLPGPRLCRRRWPRPRRSPARR